MKTTRLLLVLILCLAPFAFAQTPAPPAAAPPAAAPPDATHADVPCRDAKGIRIELLAEQVATGSATSAPGIPYS